MGGFLQFSMLTLILNLTASVKVLRVGCGFGHTKLLIA